jgi:hypothetical protein
MNIHLYVAITTIVFYFILLQFKKDVIKGSNKNLIYVIFIPIIFYIYYFIYNEEFTEISLPDHKSITEQSSDLLSAAYPLSSDL